APARSGRRRAGRRRRHHPRRRRTRARGGRRRARVHTEGLPPQRDHRGPRRARRAAGGAVTEPAVRRGSRWGVGVCAGCAIAALAAGVAAVVLDASVLALVATAIAVAVAAVGVWLDVRRTRAEQSLLEARAQTRGLRRQLRALEAQQAEQASAPSESTDDWEIDPATGLIREEHLPVVLMQVIATARRNVQPVSVVFWEVDGLDSAPATARDQALTALAAVAWRTMRESDAVFRLGPDVALGVLVDTAEPG